MSYLVTFSLETAKSNDLIFCGYIHWTLGSVIDYIILTFPVIKDHLKTKCGSIKSWVGGKNSGKTGVVRVHLFLSIIDLYDSDLGFYEHIKGHSP